MEDFVTGKPELAGELGGYANIVGPRLAHEFSRVDQVLHQQGVKSTITIFGSARIKPGYQSDAKVGKDRDLSKFYDDARTLSRLLALGGKADGSNGTYVATGGGPGIMEAANRGASDAGARNVGFGIELPFEAGNNEFVSPQLSFEFKYFLIRKFHLMKRAKCLIVFPGGIGSIDEMAEALTLRQTGKTAEYPIILYGREFWKRVLDLDFMVEYGTMSASDLDLIQYADTPEEAFRMVP